MATSGIISNASPQVIKMIETAYRRAGLKSERVTGEHLSIALDALNMWLASLANDKFLLCMIDTIIMPMYENVNKITAPVGTIDLLNYNYRTFTRLEGNYVSSAGGNVNYAFDNDLLVGSSLTQTSPDGNILVDFGAGEAPQISSIGYYPNVSSTLSLVFESSPDNSVWRTLMTTGANAYIIETWKWWDIERMIPDRYFRIRATGGGTIDAREIFIGAYPTELPMYRFNRDSYANLPNKYIVGRPLQFWLDRPNTDPVVNFWPVPGIESRYAQMVCKRYRYLMDVTELSQTAELPRKIYEAICFALAWRLSMEVPETDFARGPALKVNADEQLTKALDDDRDDSPFQFINSLSMYTR